MPLYRISAPYQILEAHKALIATKYRSAIAEKVDKVIDEAMADVADALSSDELVLSRILRHVFLTVPGGLNVFPDDVFARRMLATIVVVAHKITSCDPLVLDSIAEEIAFKVFVGSGLGNYEMAHDDEGIDDEDVDAFDRLLTTFVKDPGVLALWSGGRKSPKDVDLKAVDRLKKDPPSWFRKNRRGARPLPYEPGEPCGPISEYPG
jgi:hypothetical protein